MLKDRKRILVTNDDGIGSYSTQFMAELLRDRGHEVILATPKDNMSGVGGGITLYRGIDITNVGDNFIIDGTPCDCINIAKSGLLGDNNYDLVISGVNRGENTGLGIFESGTVGAALRAKNLGYKAVAISYADASASIERMKSCTRYAVDMLESLEYSNYGSGCEVININIPQIDGEFCKLEVKESYLGKGRYDLKFTEIREGNYVYSNDLDSSTFEEGCDNDIISQGYTSITRIKI